MYADVAAAFERAQGCGFEGVRHDPVATQETGHGRQERRVYTVLYDPAGLSPPGEWKGLRSVVRVERRRRVGDKESVEVAYHLSSSAAAAAVLARGIRWHGGLENTTYTGSST